MNAERACAEVYNHRACNWVVVYVRGSLLRPLEAVAVLCACCDDE